MQDAAGSDEPLSVEPTLPPTLALQSTEPPSLGKGGLSMTGSE